MRRKGLLPALGLLALVWALVGPVLVPRDGLDRALCLTVLDVGQGDALLIDLPGQIWLVDGGGAPGSRRDIGEERVVPALRARGIDRVDRVVLTHGDADHIGGLFAVLEQLEVGELLIPSRSRMSGGERTLVRLARARGVPVAVADEGAGLTGLPGGVHGAVLHPTPGWVPADPADRNGASVVLRIGLGAVDFLLTGDIEEATERHLLNQGVITPVAVLKLGHHGSRTSTSPRFLAAVDPLVAVAGAGTNNRFGFPHAAVTARLSARQTPLFWTGRHGPVRVCTDGFEVRVASADPSEPGFAPWAATATEVAVWRSAVRRAPAPEIAVLPSKPPARRARARRPRARPSKAGAGSGNAPAADPAPPELLDDRTWERRRKASRLRAPWRGSR